MDDSREIPLKDYEAGEYYTGDEVAALERRWTGEDCDAVAKWIAEGADEDSSPPCVSRIEPAPYGPKYDLRGINLMNRIERVRSQSDRKPVLARSRMEHANLHGCHLEWTDLQQAHLEHARLGDAYLQNADLMGAHLHHAYLFGGHCEDAVMKHAHFEYAVLGNAHLERAQMEGCNLCHADGEDEAHFEGAHLVGAYLEDGCFPKAHFDGGDLTGSHMERADLSGASIIGTNLSGVFLDRTRFSGVRWHDGKIAKVDSRLFQGFDVRGILYSEPLFDEFVRQAEFIRDCRKTWPRAYWFWWISCDCGRSPLRLLLFCLGIIAVFAAVFRVTGIVQPVDDAPFQMNWITAAYFSVVTFSTLGFGDVTPCNAAGQIAVMLEVLLGYVALGALITVFSMKILPPR